MYLNVCCNQRSRSQSAIDSRLCLCCIPTFVSEERIKELLITFGQLKFYALQKDEEGKSVRALG